MGAVPSLPQPPESANIVSNPSLTEKVNPKKEVLPIVKRKEPIYFDIPKIETINFDSKETNLPSLKSNNLNPKFLKQNKNLDKKDHQKKVLNDVKSYFEKPEKIILTKNSVIQEINLGSSIDNVINESVIRAVREMEINGKKVQRVHSKPIKAQVRYHRHFLRKKRHQFLKPVIHKRSFLQKMVDLLLTYMSISALLNFFGEDKSTLANVKGKKLKAAVHLSTKINLPLKRKLQNFKNKRKKINVFSKHDLMANQGVLQPLLVGEEIKHVERKLHNQLFTPISFGKDAILNSHIQLDSGASTNLIGKKMALKLVELGLVNYIHVSQQTMLFDVQKNLIVQPHNPINVTITFGSTPVDISFNVVESLEYPLLGVTTMIAANMSIINNNNESFLLIGEFNNPETIVKNLTSEPNNVLLLKNENIISGINKVSCFSCIEQGVVEISPKNEFKDTCLFIPQQSVEINDFKAELQIYNLSDSSFELQENTTIGSLTHLNTCWDQELDDDETDNSRFKFPLNETQGQKLLDSAEPFSLPIEEELVNWEHEFCKDGIFPADLRDEFVEFVKNETPNIFSKTEYDCGCLDSKYGFIEDFPLTSDVPISSKPYRLNSVRAAQVQTTFDRLEKNGLVKKGHSPYATPCLLVPKSDGRLRLVIDYRAFNAMCENSHQPIPRIDTLLQMISDSSPSIFSTCDISNAFHSLQLGEKAMQKASIITTNSQYLPTRLIFGYKNSPALFIQALQKVFDELPKDDSNIPYCTFYFDDIVIFSKNKIDHIRHLKNVFSLLHKVGLKIQSTKNHFFKPRVELLGKVITGTTISPQKKHIQSLNKFPQPTNIKQLQSFLGICTWNCNLICDYTRTIQPLTKLLRKNEPFIWGTEQQQTFTYIKEVLTEFTAQYFVDYSLPLYLACDASDKFIAGILYQIKSYSKDELPKLLESLEHTKELHKLPKPKHLPVHPLLPKGAIGIPTPFKLTKEGIESPHDMSKLQRDAQSASLLEGDTETENIEQFLGSQDKLHLICNVGYFSSSLSKSQAAYSIIEKEAFAVVSSLEFFKPILQGANDLYVLSDSRPFLFIMKLMRCGISRLQRWSVKLFSMPYTIIMVHVKGTVNYSDSLTRVWSVEDDYEVKPDMKKPILVESPFKIGQLITHSDLLNAIDNNPNLVSFTPKYSYKNCEHISTIKYVGTSLISEIEKMITISEIRKAQKTDNYCRQLKEADKFYQYNNIWYKMHLGQKDKDDKGRIIVPRSLVSPVIALFHVENHAGVTNLHSYVKSIYFFPNMLASIRQFVQLCHLCAIYKSSTAPKLPVGLRDIDPMPKNSVWSLDVVEGFPSYKNTGSYLSIVEYYSGYRIIVPLKNSTSKEIAKIIEKDIISTFGPPMLMISDNGTNLLKSKNVKKLCNFYGIQTHLTSPYHPSSHGRIEVSHQSITTLLKISSDTLGKPWFELCPFVQIALNSRPSTTLGGLTPMYFMFGTNLDYRRKKNIKLSDIPDIKEQKLIWDLHDKACKDILKEYNLLRNKLNIKKGGKMVNYEKGDFVWARNFTKAPKMKMQSKYLSEPMEVLKDFGHAILVKNYYGIVIKLHKNNVKLYPPQNLELYQALPFKTKLQLGAKFNEKDLQNYFNDLTKEEEEIVSKEIENLDIFTPQSNNPETVDPFFDDEDSDLDSQDEQPNEETPFLINNNITGGKKYPKLPDQPLHMNLRKKVRFLK